MSWRRTSPKPRPESPVFLIDEGFPQPLIEQVRRLAGKWRAPLNLVFIGELEPRLRSMADYKLIQYLWQEGLDGLITSDHSMLERPEVIAMIQDVKLAVIACRSANDRPLLATGLVIAHLEWILKRFRRGTGQIWILGTTEQRPADADAYAREHFTGRSPGPEAFRLKKAALLEPVLPPQP